MPAMWPSCTRSPTLNSSTFARVMMSPATPAETSSYSLPCDLRMCPGRKPFFSSLSIRFVSDLRVPLKMRMVEYFMFDFGSKPMRNTRPASGSLLSAFNCVTVSPSINSAGSTSVGEGLHLAIRSSSCSTPTSCLASVKTMGITVPD